MSLNWKEIDLILSELDLPGSRIQKVIMSSYEVLGLQIYGRGGAKMLLVSLSPRACRFHQTYHPIPKTKKPLRFGEFLQSNLLNSRIEGARQLGRDRIIQIDLRSGEEKLCMYIRLWSNAANLVLVNGEGKILDAMRRIPRRGEVTGGTFVLPKDQGEEREERDYQVRDFNEDLMAELPEGASFNRKIDALYRQEGGSLSLEGLREELQRRHEGTLNGMESALAQLKEKETEFTQGDLLRQYGDLILANAGSIEAGASWLEAENFYTDPPSPVRIKLDPQKSPAASAEGYYEQYRKAKSGLGELSRRIEEIEGKILKEKETYQELLKETNPLVLHKLMQNPRPQGGKNTKEAGRPGLSFRKNDWLMLVGRDATENDALLRKHVKGNDLWLHARDFPGSYVFIKQRSGKTVPLDILLDAGNLALFYSKGRNKGEGDLIYTPVKYLRRAKNGPKGLVIPTQEKNLYVRIEESRLKVLEECRE